LRQKCSTRKAPSKPSRQIVFDDGASLRKQTAAVAVGGLQSQTENVAGSLDGPKQTLNISALPLLLPIRLDETDKLNMIRAAHSLLFPAEKRAKPQSEERRRK
jgi:hypothetical protein